MSEIKCPDSGGCMMTLLDVDGRYLTPGNSREQWNAITKLPTRPDDVFICAYPKSGLHWLWEITSMLRSGEATVVKDLMEFHMLDFLPVNMQADLEKRPSPRTFTTHKYPDELPRMALEQKSKIIFVSRDPKDACVSYFHHLIKLKQLDYDGKFDDFVQLFLEGNVPFNSWWKYMTQWCDFTQMRPDQPFMTIYYEDMKTDPVSQIKSLASYLEIDAGEDLINNIAKSTNFTTMKPAKESLENPLVTYYKTGKEIMYRKGEIGDWKNWFTVSKSSEFDEFVKTKLEGVKYESLVTPQRYTCLK